MTPYSEDLLRGVLSQHSSKGVLFALQTTQEVLGYVPDSSLNVIADVCNVSRAEVYGVFTFYSDLRKTPPAQVVIKVCVAESCQAVGSRTVVDELHARGYDVHAGTIQDDIACEQIFCLGNCALSPAALINGVPMGRVTADALLHAASEMKQ